jgi:hypothetical protein
MFQHPFVGFSVEHALIVQPMSAQNKNDTKQDEQSAQSQSMILELVFGGRGDELHR